jgi:hypothetical protein
MIQGMEAGLPLENGELNLVAAGAAKPADDEIRRR